MTLETSLSNAQVSGGATFNMLATELDWNFTTNSVVAEGIGLFDIPAHQGQVMGVSTPGFTLYGLIDTANPSGNTITFDYLQRFMQVSGISYLQDVLNTGSVQTSFQGNNSALHTGSVPVMFTSLQTARKADPNKFEITYELVGIMVSGVG